MSQWRCLRIDTSSTLHAYNPWSKIHPRSIDRCVFYLVLGQKEIWIGTAQKELQKNVLGPQTTIYTWYFQLDDSKSLHRKWLFSNQTSILNLLFRIGCIEFPIPKPHPKTRCKINSRIDCQRDLSFLNRK